MAVTARQAWDSENDSEEHETSQVVTITRTGPSDSFGFGMGRTANGRHIVINVEPAGLADAAGLEVGDELLKVDDIGTDHLSHATVARVICRRLAVALTVQKHAATSSDIAKISANHSTAELGSTPSRADHYRERRQRRRSSIISPAKAPRKSDSLPPGVIGDVPPLSEVNHNPPAESFTTFPVVEEQHDDVDVISPVKRPTPDNEGGNKDSAQSSRDATAPEDTPRRRRGTSQFLPAGAENDPSVHELLSDPSSHIACTGRVVFLTLLREHRQSLGFNLIGGTNNSFGGLFVRAVNAGSPAEAAGLQVGDRILAVDGHGALTLEHADGTALLKQSGHRTELAVLRGGASGAGHADADELGDTGFWEDILVELKHRRHTNITAPLPFIRDLDLSLFVTDAAVQDTSGPVLSVQPPASAIITFVGGVPSPCGAIFVASALYSDDSVQAGDRLLEANGQSLLRTSLNDLRTQIARWGPDVKLTLQRVGTSAWEHLCAVLDVDIDAPTTPTCVFPSKLSSSPQEATSTTPQRLPAPEPDADAALKGTRDNHSTAERQQKRREEPPPLPPKPHAKPRGSEPSPVVSKTSRAASGPMDVTLTRQADGSFGVTLAGTLEPARTPEEQPSTGVFVLRSSPGAARQGLREGTRVLMARQADDGSSQPVQDPNSILEIFASDAQSLWLRVEPARKDADHVRRELEMTALPRDVVLNDPSKRGRFGVHLHFDAETESAFIVAVDNNSPASASRQVRIGDEVLSINDTPVAMFNEDELVQTTSTGSSLVLGLQANPLAWRSLRTRLRPSSRQDRRSQSEGMMTTEGPLLVVTVHRGKESAGFRVVGGSDHRLGGLFVMKVMKESPAHRAGLQAGDRILDVNGVGVLAMTFDQAVGVLHKSPDPLRMVVLRLGHQQFSMLAEASKALSVAPPFVRSLAIDLEPGGQNRVSTYGDILALTLHGPESLKLVGGVNSRLRGVFVSRATPEWPELKEGDRLLQINTTCLLEVSPEMLQQVFKHEEWPVTLYVQRLGTDQWQRLCSLLNLRVKDTGDLGVAAATKRHSPEAAAETGGDVKGDMHEDVFTGDGEADADAQTPEGEQAAVQTHKAVSTASTSASASAREAPVSQTEVEFAPKEDGPCALIQVRTSLTGVKLASAQGGGVAVVKAPEASALRPGDRLMAVEERGCLLSSKQDVLDGAIEDAKAPASVTLIRPFVRDAVPLTSTVPSTLPVTHGPLLHAVARASTVSSQPVGIKLIGGIDTVLGGLFVQHIDTSSPFFDALRLGDRVLEVNGRSCLGFAPQDAEAMASSGLVVQRTNSGEWQQLRAAGLLSSLDLTTRRTARLIKQTGSPIGLRLLSNSSKVGPVFISRVQEGSIAAQSGLVEHGDRILSINGQDVLMAKEGDAMQLIRQDPEAVELVLAKDTETYHRFAKHFERQTSSAAVSPQRQAGIQEAAAKDIAPASRSGRAEQNTEAEPQAAEAAEPASLAEKASDDHPRDNMQSELKGTASAAPAIEAGREGAPRDSNDADTTQAERPPPVKSEPVSASSATRQQPSSSRGGEVAPAAMPSRSSVSDAAPVQAEQHDQPASLSLADETEAGKVIRVHLERQRGKLFCTFIGGSNTKAGGIFFNAVESSKQPDIHIGDRVVSLGDDSMLTVTHDDALDLFNAAGQTLDLQLVRFPGLPSLDRTSGPNFKLKSVGKVLADTVSKEELARSLVELPVTSLAPLFVGTDVGKLQRGDRLLALNDDTSFTASGLDEIRAQLLAYPEDVLEVTVLRLPEQRRKLAFSDSERSSKRSIRQRILGSFRRKSQARHVSANADRTATQQESRPGPSSPRGNARRGSTQLQAQEAPVSLAAGAAQGRDSKPPQQSASMSIQQKQEPPNEAAAQSHGPVTAKADLSQPAQASSNSAEGQPRVLNMMPVKGRNTKLTPLEQLQEKTRRITFGRKGGSFGFSILANTLKPDNVTVGTVVEGGAAEAAGLHGDDLILAINGTPTTRVFKKDVMAVIKAADTLDMLVASPFTEEESIDGDQDF